MSRIVSVWLKAWPIARLLQAQAAAAPADPQRPLVLVAPGSGGTRVVALNRAAQLGGLVVSDLLSNARSKVLDLQSRDADPTADAAALDKLALWALRYTPVVAPWDAASGADGMFLDIAGCAHLFGGEQHLLADLARRLRAFGLVARLAIADTAGASWAMARYGPGDKTIVPPREEVNALRPLPLTALRLSEDTLSLLRRLGFRRIGDVIDQPRAPFATRFEKLLLRLDQALGRAPDPLTPIVPPPVYRAQAMFLEPIVAGEHVLEAAKRLLSDLVRDLARDEAGARVLRLLLFRVMSKTCFQHDGRVRSLDLGLAAPSRDPEHIARLIALRLDSLADDLDADFGFEAAAVHVLVAEPLPERQVPLAMSEDSPPPDALAQLIDRLQQRLGASAVRQLRPHQSHIPERAMRARPASPSPRASPTSPHTPSARGEGRGEGRPHTPAALVAAPHLMPEAWLRHDPLPMLEKAWGEGISLRPLLLLPHPEPAEVVALIPDSPPRQFRWRGVLHQVASAQGPERIAPEWWRRTGEVERDYYVVEDTAGRRFWLYRAGLYDRGEATPQWFMHGVFG